MNSDLQNSEISFLFKGQKQEFLEWLESLKISKYWLDTLSESDSFALCKEVYHNLQILKGLDLIEKEKLLSLTEIDFCLSGIYEKLHHSYLDAKYPLRKSQQNNVNLIIQTYMELTQAYYEIIFKNSEQKEKISEHYLALISCKAFLSLGVVFLTASEVYTNPPDGFWLLCYQLFSKSEKLNLLDHKVKVDDKVYSPAVLFKKLIIFYIIDKSHHSPRDIDEIFKLIIRGINYIQSYMWALIDVSDIETEIFGFSLDKDCPPEIQSNCALATAKLSRYVTKSEVLKIIQFILHELKTHSISSISYESFSRILIALEHQKNKRQTRINKKYGCRAIIGLDNLIDFFLEKEGKKGIEKNKLDYKDDFDDFEIMLDFDSDNKNKDINNPVIETLQIIDSSISGYGISCGNNMAEKLQIGEVIGIIPDSSSAIKKIEIGLVRRIKVTAEGILFGVELIGLESTLIYIEREHSDTPSEWVLFVFGSPNFDVGVLCHKERNYQVGESIFVHLAEKKVPCQLGKILNATPVLEHLALVY